jgi:hypothetical protein
MSLTIDGKSTDMFVTKLTPPAEPVTLLLPYCSRYDVWRLDLPMQPVLVQELWQFDVKGHVFAYGVRAGWVSPSGTGPLIHIGMASEVIFIDDRGDGVFRVMINSPYPFRPPRPAWLDKLP